MPWKVSKSPVEDSSLHAPHKTSSQQMPRAFYRTLKYLILLLFLLFLLISANTLYLASIRPYFNQVPARPVLTSNHTAPSHSNLAPPIIGKVTASFGPPDAIYDSAIASHRPHNDRFGYPHFILRQRMLPGLWTKHAALLTVIGSELAKPEEKRLQWLMWHDRDVILMNFNVPLEAFLPPESTGVGISVGLGNAGDPDRPRGQFDHINAIVTRDRNGLNNGVFLIRVSEWGIKMFASALSVREYERGVELKYSEQSGMERVIERPWWSSSVAYVPQRWFNGFPPKPDSPSKSVNSTSAARPGSLLIHFASNRDGRRPERMAYWQNKTGEWSRPYNETGYEAEIKEYWERVKRNESMESICADIGARGWE